MSFGEKNPTRQAVGFAAVILFHAAMIYALANGLAHQMVEIVQAPLLTKIVADIKPPPPDALPPPPPQLAPPPPPYIPPPEVQIQQPVAATSTAITAIVHEKPPAPAPVPQPVHVPVRIPAVIDAAHRCKTPDYPAMAQRLGEEGTVVLQFLIGTDGAVVQSKVQSSSGHDRLDEAARAALGQCEFKPGTSDGKPEPSWAVIKYTWKLE